MAVAVDEDHQSIAVAVNHNSQKMWVRAVSKYLAVDQRYQ